MHGCVLSFLATKQASTCWGWGGPNYASSQRLLNICIHGLMFMPERTDERGVKIYQAGGLWNIEGMRRQSGMEPTENQPSSSQLHAFRSCMGLGGGKQSSWIVFHLCLPFIIINEGAEKNKMRTSGGIKKELHTQTGNKQFTSLIFIQYYFPSFSNLSHYVASPALLWFSPWWVHWWQLPPPAGSK